ncbi:GH92 family glycosyl hydrolase [Stigmatella aurantiaca]|uniref:Alpha-1,2-mannosidase family protein n=1 Tax=Stigmatella aurantiaca (strain DW4/3-1) TaxID=378806 RepID=Q097W8_STIAD|nr:GH92 family glycosyl hydrolase [Stigmatella aurantiaca]ADO68467.1 Alpha-1,2-mannosidase family protein [Stigmatella aurantiaca DW4/3-1]EAU67976.1 immunoreactive 87kD antigen PG92 [Stigmatella aurantiaca DW4/3-1]
MWLLHRRNVVGLAIAGLLLAGCKNPSPPIEAPDVPGEEEPPPPPPPPVDPTQFVNPFIGTQNFGNTFPGASAPFGMVQLSPDTGGQGGYDYQQDALYGFSQTHLSGVGCGVMGELPIMPTTGAVESVDINGYKSKYSHDDEEATPGYYRVGLSRYGIRAELTATERTGWLRFTFPSTATANVLFNTGKANQAVQDSEIHVVGDRTLEGRVRAGGFCAGRDQHTVYFTATFDRPFASHGTWRGSTPLPGSRDASGSGNNGAWVTFDATTDLDVTVKVGLSYTGLEGARKNLAKETGESFDFEATRTRLHDAWADKLRAIQISGGTRDRQAAFYSALYHAQLHPNLAGDVDGRYVGFDNQVHEASGYTPYQNFSLWDTYRPQNHLLEVLEPQIARDVALSILAIGRHGGWLPRWSLANSETNIMTGDPVTPFLVDVWARGLLEGHEQEAYAMLRKNALQAPPSDSPYNGRSGIEFYNGRGYIPSGLKLGVDCAHKGGDNDCVHPASATLEYAAADAALALMAQGLGHEDDARMFAERGQWYRNLWDSSIGQFRPRTSDGTWLTPYDPVEASHQFHEGGAYQYQWLVPQDPAGLVALMGGERATEQRLDAFFAYDKLLADPAGTAHADWITQPYDYYGKPTYNPNNEPDLLAPYMYLWAGAPAKTATVVRAAMTLFTPGPDGMTGNDDLGTMSAWYVFSSLGVYPTMSGANFLALSSPQFESAVVRVGAFGSRQASTLTLTAPGASDTRRYIQRVTLGDQELTRTYVEWNEILRGGRLAYVLGDEPSSWGTGSSARPPSVNPGEGDSRRHVDASVRPSAAVLPLRGEAQTIELTLDVLGQAPQGLDITVTPTVPAGWSASATSFALSSRRLPVQWTGPLAITVPANTPAGVYPLQVVVSAEGANTVTRNVTLELRPAGACLPGVSGTCAVDLTNDRNHDGTATVAQSREGNFDGQGWSYDATLLPAAGSVTWAGVTYSAPDPNGTANNFVEARGQGILLPGGNYQTLHLVSASHNGPVTTTVSVRYTDGSVVDLPVTAGDWAGSAPSGSSVLLDMPHRIKAGSGVDGPPVRLFGQSLALDPAKQVHSMSLPNDARFEVYAITLS